MINLKAALSFGLRNLYNLKVRAQDGGTNSRIGEADVIITVEDTNDFNPVFNPTTYSKTISESVAIGSSILRVTASDQDSGPSGQISYSIQSGNVGNAFIINSQSGGYQMLFIFKLILKRWLASFFCRHSSTEILSYFIILSI